MHRMSGDYLGQLMHIDMNNELLLTTYYTLNLDSIDNTIDNTTFETPLSSESNPISLSRRRLHLQESSESSTHRKMPQFRYLNRGRYRNIPKVPHLVRS